MDILQRFEYFRTEANTKYRKLFLVLPGNAGVGIGLCFQDTAMADAYQSHWL